MIKLAAQDDAGAAAQKATSAWDSIKKWWDGPTRNDVTDPAPIKWLQNNGNIGLLGLAGGLGAGGIAALLGSREAPRIGESATDRRNRIIRNSLVAGGLGGAGAAALGKGTDLLWHSSAHHPTSVNFIDRLAGIAPDVITPFAAKTGVGAVAGGTAGGWWANKFKPRGYTHLGDELLRQRGQFNANFAINGHGPAAMSRLRDNLDKDLFNRFSGAAGSRYRAPSSGTTAELLNHFLKSQEVRPSMFKEIAGGGLLGAASMNVLPAALDMFNKWREGDGPDK